MARECQPLTDLCEFVTADSVESFVLSYTTLLTSAPGISPTLLANLINARAATDKNMTKADAREVSGRQGEAVSISKSLWLPKKMLSGSEIISFFLTSSFRCWSTAEKCMGSAKPGRGVKRWDLLRRRQRRQQRRQPRQQRAPRHPRPRRQRSRPRSTRHASGPVATAAASAGQPLHSLEEKDSLG